jgi:hypothetical protein
MFDHPSRILQPFAGVNVATEGISLSVYGVSVELHSLGRPHNEITELVPWGPQGGALVDRFDGRLLLEPADLDPINLTRHVITGIAAYDPVQEASLDEERFRDLWAPTAADERNEKLKYDGVSRYIGRLDHSALGSEWEQSRNTAAAMAYSYSTADTVPDIRGLIPPPPPAHAFKHGAKRPRPAAAETESDVAPRSMPMTMPAGPVSPVQLRIMQRVAAFAAKRGPKAESKLVQRARIDPTLSFVLANHIHRPLFLGMVAHARDGEPAQQQQQQQQQDGGADAARLAPHQTIAIEKGRNELEALLRQYDEDSDDEGRDGDDQDGGTRDGTTAATEPLLNHAAVGDLDVLRDNGDLETYGDVNAAEMHDIEPMIENSVLQRLVVALKRGGLALATFIRGMMSASPECAVLLALRADAVAGTEGGDGVRECLLKNGISPEIVTTLVGDELSARHSNGGGPLPAGPQPSNAAQGEEQTTTQSLVKEQGLQTANMSSNLGSTQPGLLHLASGETQPTGAQVADSTAMEASFAVESSADAIRKAERLRRARELMQRKDAEKAAEKRALRLAAAAAAEEERRRQLAAISAHKKLFVDDDDDDEDSRYD